MRPKDMESTQLEYLPSGAKVLCPFPRQDLRQVGRDCRKLQGVERSLPKENRLPDHFLEIWHSTSLYRSAQRHPWDNIIRGNEQEES
jgi:hypothetical protein